MISNNLSQSKIKASLLSAGYGKKIVVDNVSFEAHPGEILVLIGPNGSGKSTILKTITGQLKSIYGSVYVCEKDIKDITSSDIAKSVSLVMTQKISPEHMSCREVVATGRYPYTGHFGFLSDDDKRKVNQALLLTDSLELAECDFDKISDGQRQRIMLAKAICQETEVIVLDEPTTFLDMYYKLELMKIIRQLARDQKKTIVMSLHELDLVRMIADVVVCVDQKSVIKTGSVDEIFTGDFISRLYGVSPDEFDASSGRMMLKEKVALNETQLHCGYKGNTCHNAVENENNDTCKVIMVQGTMSGVGKSLVVAGLCRVFRQDGYKVAPFKSQNMALNSYVTREGLEMGRAQVMQAEAAGVAPTVCMNPILLKPTDNVGSQVIVNGKVVGNMKAREYFERKTDYIPDIMSALNTLRSEYEIIVIEGAGSPAEINLKQNDIVNMGMAHLADAPVILVGDIDRGGVFAQLLGTLELLDEDEQNRIKGLVINKFRGDKSILDPGVLMLEKRGQKKVVGVLPYMDISLEDEDSLSDRFRDDVIKKSLDIAVIKLPRISNFTDFDTFDQIENVSVRYVKNAASLNNPDMIIIPGSKSTISDMKWLRESGLEIKIKQASKNGTIIFGVCGGYQMLGRKIADPLNSETGGEIMGLSLLPVETVIEDSKMLTQFEGYIVDSMEPFSNLKDKSVKGYEIHMGKTTLCDDVSDDGVKEFTSNSTGYCSNNIFGTYIHGFFDEREVLSEIVYSLANKKGVLADCDKVMDYSDFKEREYDRLADMIREHMDMDAIYRMMD